MKMKPNIYFKISVFQAKEADFNLCTVLGKQTRKFNLKKERRLVIFCPVKSILKKDLKYS